MATRLFGICCAALFFISGCSSADRERKEILHLLVTRTSALNTRDVPLYLSIVSPRYSYKGKDFGQLEESLKTDFRGIEIISYLPGTPTITVTGSSAESVTSYRMKVVSQGKEVKLNGTEHLKLAKEPGGWKIIAGI